jgi:hypothetical protein
MNMNEYELTDVERERMTRVIKGNEREFRSVHEGLLGAGHRHLAADMLAMINEYIP